MGGDPVRPVPLVVGANQRSSSLFVRDRLYVADGARSGFLADLKAAGIDQAVLVSTCDRIEVQAVHGQPEEAARRIEALMARHAGLAREEIEGELYVMTGEAALRHIFCVAASLDSTVIGEAHVLAQVKESHRASRAAGLTGSALEAVVQWAFAAAKRVRTETAIGQRPVSVAAAAVDLAEGVHGDLGRSQALLIGTGEMGEVIAAALRAAGLSRLFVTDTHPARAEVAARRFLCHTLPFAGLAEAVGRADIIIGSLGSRTPLVTLEMTRAGLRQRRNRPMVLVDTAIPGDIDPLADRLDGVFLYTLDDLERVARDGRKARESEADAARRIIEEEVSAFLQERAERAAVPALARLRSHFESVRAQALADAGGDAEKATRLLINRLLHDPTRLLREIAGRGDDADLELTRAQDLIRRLFGFDEDDEREP